MSSTAPDDFEERMRAQNASLRQQLAVLAKMPRARRQKLVLLEVVCRGCGDLLVEVVATSPYPVVRSRGLDEPDRAMPDREEGEPSKAYGRRVYEERHREYDQSLRLGEWKFWPLPRPWPVPGSEGYRSLIVPFICRCRHGHLTYRYLHKALVSNTPKVTLPNG